MASENANVKSELEKVKSEIHTKKNGNRMLSAIMRGLKMKLEDEMAKNRQVIDQQALEIEQYSQAVQQQQYQVETLTTKIEKKKFKATQSKKLIAQTEQKMADLQSRVGQSNQDLEQRIQAFDQLKHDNEELRSTLHVKKNGNVMMNALMKGLKLKLEEEMAKSQAEI